MPIISPPRFDHLVDKAKYAQQVGSPGACSTGEALAAALILDRPDWIASMGYTLAEAIGRIDADWVEMIPLAERQVQSDCEGGAYAPAERLCQEKLAMLRDRQMAGDPLRFSAQVISLGNAPEYRNLALKLDLVATGEARAQPMRAMLAFSASGTTQILEYVGDIHRRAWRRGRPLDAQADEAKPAWLDGQ